jgi:hypothetical protein
MGWKTINGHRYYYRLRWAGGRVETRYCGAGEAGYLFAELDALDRLEKAAERQVQQQERDEADAEERAVAEWFDDVQAVADAAIVAAGFHKHRGQRHDKAGPAQWRQSSIRPADGRVPQESRQGG